MRKALPPDRIIEMQRKNFRPNLANILHTSRGGIVRCPLEGNVKRKRKKEKM
jgi:hypothetical protein